MEHYLEHTDYPIWEFIQKGNGLIQVSTDTNGQIRVLPPKTAKEILARKRERKARTTLLMAIPEDHLAKFHKMTDAKKYKKQSNLDLGLHKGCDRFQSILSQPETHGAGVSTEDVDQKFLRSLPSSWSQVSLIMRTKPGIDTLNFDDHYNNLRVFESNVKGSTGSSSSTQNVAFVSSDNTSSTNEVNTAYGVSTSSGHNSQKEGSSSYTDDLIIRRDAGNTGYKERDNRKRHAKQDKHKAMVTIDGEGINWTGHAKDDTEDYALMAFNSSNSGSYTYVTSCSKMSAKDKSGLGYGSQIHDGVLGYANEVFESVFDSRSSDVEDNLVNDRFANIKGMHVVPPPMIGNYINFASCDSNSSVETLESVPNPVANEPKAVSEPKVWHDAPIIEEYESDTDDEHVTIPSKEQEKPSFAFVNTVNHVKTPRQTVKGQNTCSQNSKPNKRD
nr:xylulose kinase-1 [Tanacetum cinerariifolium]